MVKVQIMFDLYKFAYFILSNSPSTAIITWAHICFC